MLESKVETYFKRTIKDIGGLALKFQSGSVNGVPDEVVLFKGTTYFVELKAPNQKPRANQRAIHRTFAKYGIIVHICSSFEEVDTFVQNVLKAKRPQKTAKKKNVPITKNQFRRTEKECT